MEEQKNRKRNADGELKVKVKEEKKKKKRLKIGEFDPSWKKVQYITLPKLQERKSLKLYYDIVGSITFPLNDAINILLNGKIQQPFYLEHFVNMHFRNTHDFKTLQRAIMNKFVNDNGIDLEKEPERLKDLGFDFSVAGLALRYYGRTDSFNKASDFKFFLQNISEWQVYGIRDGPSIDFTSFNELMDTESSCAEEIWEKIEDNTFDHAEVDRFGLGLDHREFYKMTRIFEEASGCDKYEYIPLNIASYECRKVLFLAALDKALSVANYSLVLNVAICNERSTWSTLISHGVTVEYFYTAVVTARRYGISLDIDTLPYIVFDHSGLVLQFSELYDHHWKIAFIYISKLISNYHKESSTPLPPVNFDTIYHGIFRLFELDFRVLKVLKQRYQ